MTGAGHNGGPSLEEPVHPPPGTCGTCRHWQPPEPGEVRRYEIRRLTGRGASVREPSGGCDRMLVRPGAIPAHCGTKGRTSACHNFAPAAPASPPAWGGGYVTVWQGDRIAWQGWEEHLPDQFRREEREAGYQAAQGSLLDKADEGRSDPSTGGQA